MAMLKVTRGLISQSMTRSAWSKQPKSSRQWRRTISNKLRLKWGFPICYRFDLLFDRTQQEQLDTNTRCILHLLKPRLPYCGEIHLSYDQWQTIKSQIAETADGPDSESLRDWDELWTCLEQNRVGMATLHQTVASSVPLGLWPQVLAKTTMKMSSPVEEEDWDRNMNPVDGLFGLVQGLGVGGYLTKHHGNVPNDVVCQERNKRTRLN